MLFITAGRLRYYQSTGTPQPTSACSRSDNCRGQRLTWGQSRISYTRFGIQDDDVCLFLRKGLWICEAAIWVHWENQGVLLASVDSLLLALESVEFGAAVKEHSDAHERACVYAHVFVQELENGGTLSDYMDPPQDYAATSNENRTRVGSDQQNSVDPVS